MITRFRTPVEVEMLKSVLFVLLFGWMYQSSQITTAMVTSPVLNQSCTTPGGNHGRCIPVTGCNFVRKILHKPRFSKVDQRYLEGFSCGKDPVSGKKLVCCPQLNSEKHCGELRMQEYILGGEETEPDEFPWVARLRYRNRKGQITSRCGGTLISDRYVVTAAHCVVNPSQKLVEVRLGEWDADTTEDCTETRCFVGYQDDYPVEKITVHEGYFPLQLNKVHDIALLKLKTTVERTLLVAPICVPSLELADSLQVVGQSFDVAGWGRTETGSSSRRKMKVSLPGRNITVCNALLAENVSLTENQLCVGGIVGKDSCQGDSGGPLMAILENRWHLVGIVSGGFGKCGVVAAVYTRLGSYLDWIVEKIELERRVD